MTYTLHSTATQLETYLRNLGRFTRTRFPRDNNDLVFTDRACNVFPSFDNRQILGEPQGWNYSGLWSCVSHGYLFITLYTYWNDAKTFDSIWVTITETIKHSRGELARIMTQLSNFTFDELAQGQTASYTKTVTEQDIQLFAVVSGDVNPVHLDSDYAATTPFKGRIAHGMLTGAIVSAAIALRLPGPGTIYLGQDLRFRLPVRPGDTLTVNLDVVELRAKRHQVSLNCQVFNQDEKLVASGVADVMAPTEKMTIEAPALPEVSLT